MKNSTFFVCLLVSCLVGIAIAEDVDESDARPVGGRRTGQIGTDFGQIIQDVGKLGAHLINGAGQAGQQVLRFGTGGLIG